MPIGWHQGCGSRPCTVKHGKMMRNNRNKLKQDRFRWDIRKIFFPMRTMKQRGRLLREFVQPSSF